MMGAAFRENTFASTGRTESLCVAALAPVLSTRPPSSRMTDDAARALLTEYASNVYFPYFFGQPNVRYCIFVGCMLTGYATRMVSAVYIQRICMSRQNRINKSKTIVGVGVGVIRVKIVKIDRNRAYQDPVLSRCSRFDRSSNRCDEKVKKWTKEAVTILVPL